MQADIGEVPCFYSLCLRLISAAVSFNSPKALSVARIAPSNSLASFDI
ncbi:MAG: hypothetical protein AAFX80_09225 [Cyanobacteria bacterium J06639_18]